jgi:Uma2 family endonuclease
MSIAEAPVRHFTAADLLTMPDGDRYELVDGELVEIDMSNESSWIAGEIHALIRNFAKEHDLGWAFPDNTSYQCYPWDEDRVRKPDASFIAKHRLPDGPLASGHCPIAPDLAVEVISPHDLYLDVEAKVQEYLRAGVQMVWVATPLTRTVWVHTQDQSSSLHLTEEAELSGDPVLPGFRCRVAELFPPTPAPAR